MTKTRHEILAALHQDRRRPSIVDLTQVFMSKEEIEIILAWCSVATFDDEMLPEELALKKRLEEMFP